MDEATKAQYAAELLAIEQYMNQCPASLLGCATRVAASIYVLQKSNDPDQKHLEKLARDRVRLACLLLEKVQTLPSDADMPEIIMVLEQAGRAAQETVEGHVENAAIAVSDAAKKVMRARWPEEYEVLKKEEIPNVPRASDGAPSNMGADEQAVPPEGVPWQDVGEQERRRNLLLRSAATGMDAVFRGIGDMLGGGLFRPPAVGAKPEARADDPA